MKRQIARYVVILTLALGASVTAHAQMPPLPLWELGAFAGTATARCADLLLPASKGGSAVGVSKHPDELTGQFMKTVVPDETLIFQYSALGFNSHKIHIDRSHARNVEGFPDLVVNGGLATLLMTEFLRNDVNVHPAGIKVRHIAPLFCGSPITMVAKQLEGKWQIQAYDHRFILAIDMEVDTYEL